MATPSERSLNALLNSVQRIENFLIDKNKKNSNEKTYDQKADPSIFSTSFMGIKKTIKSIETETKNTNDLLKELIEVNSLKNKEVSEDINEGAKNINRVTRSLPKFFKALEGLSKLPKTSTEKLKEILMITAFVDPDSGDPIVNQDQIDKASIMMENVHRLAGGVIKYGLAMSAFLVLSPLAIAGATAFGFSLRMLDLAMGKHADPERTEKSLSGLKQIGLAIGLFGLSMVAFSYVLPQIAKGALGFVMVITTMTLTLGLMSRALRWGAGGFKDTSPLNSLHKLGLGIAAFGLTMVLMSYAAPQIILGSGLFVTTVAALTLSLVLINRVLGSKLIMGKKKGVAPGGKGPLSTLMKLGFSIAAFSATMVLVGLFAKPFAQGALAVTLSVLALGVAIQPLGTKFAERGSRNLMKLSGALVVFTGAMALWTKLVQPDLTWESIAMLGATIGTISLIGTVLGVPPVDKFSKSGASTLILLGASLATFSAGLAIYTNFAKDLEWSDLAKLGATIGTMALIGTVLGIPAVAPLVLVGSGVLIALGASLAAFSLGMSVYANTVAGKLTNQDLVILGGTIAAMGLIGSVIGVISPLVIAGAGALVVAGGALVTISTGLSIFANSQFKQQDSENLNNALRSVISGFLGYKSMDDIGLGALAKVPTQAALLGTMSAAMIVAAGALYPITKSLKVFKEANWRRGDSEILEEVIGSVITSFTKNLDDVNFIKLWAGLKALGNVGNVLTGLATGVGAFANLSFIEQEYDEEKGKLVPKREVRLKPPDITKAGESISNVINAMVDPVAKFGEEITSGIGSFIGIPMAINSLETLGTGLVNLAKGVQGWANMTVTTWGIQKDPKTGLNKLVPTGKTVLKSTDITNAQNNITSVLGAMAIPLSKFGEAFTTGNFFSDLFDKTSVEKGIASMATLGTGLANMATGVSYWGKMMYAPMILGKNKETGLNELMPGKPIPLDISNAGKNIGKVLTALAEPLSNFGKVFSGGMIKGLFGGVTGDDIITGIEQMGIISNNLTELGKMVGNWNRFSYTEMEVKDGRLVPKKVHMLGRNAIVKAKNNILSMISVLPGSLGKYDKILESLGINREDVGSIIKEISEIQNTLGNLAVSIKDKWTSPELLEASNNYKLWLYDVADPILEKMSQRYQNLGKSITIFGKHFEDFNKPIKSKEYHTFTDKLISLSKHAKDFKIFTDSFERMAESMGKFSKNFSIMNADGIMAFSIWTDALIKATEVGNDSNAFDNFLDSADSTVNSAFKFGNKKLGFSDEDSNLNDADKRSVIDQTLQQQDSQQAKELRNLNSTIIGLRNEISTLKTIMSGTLDVNIENVNPTTKFKIDE